MTLSLYKKKKNVNKIFDNTNQIITDNNLLFFRLFSKKKDRTHDVNRLEIRKNLNIFFLRFLV